MLSVPKMQNFLKQHDIVWECPAKAWRDGLPLANGEIGVVAWGDGNPLRMTIDHYGAWEMREQREDPAQYNYANLRSLIEQKRFDEARKVFQYDAIDPKKPSAMRLQLGQLRLEFSQPSTSFTARLSLWNAEASGEMRFNKKRVKFNILLPQSENIIAIRLTGDIGVFKGFGGFPPEFRPADEAKREGWGFRREEFNTFGGFKYFTLTVPETGDIVIMWTTKKIKQNEMWCFGTIATYWEGNEPRKIAGERLRVLSDISSIRKVIGQHYEWWHGYWEKSWLTIPDSELEALYYAEIYKLGCSTQPGKWAAGLQGPWIVDPTSTIPENTSLPPWAGEYCLDLALQFAYYPVYTANRLELGEPVYRMFWELLPRFQKECKEFYGWEGAFAQVSLGPKGGHVHGWYTVNTWPGSGPWLAHLFWLHYLYSQDKEFLKKKAYPFMREFFRMYCGLLEKGEDGFYHLPCITSPEWGSADAEAWGSDSHCDLALIRWLWDALLKSVEVLGINEPLLNEWKEKLAKLVPYPQDDATGLQIMKDAPLSHSHRHFSHLMAIYPLDILTIEGSEEDRKLIAKSIRWMITKGTGEWACHSYPHAAWITSRIRRGNYTWDLLHRYIRAHVSKNTFVMCGDPKRMGFNEICPDDSMTVETGFGIADVMMTMLLQSWGGVLRVFPSLPDHWKESAFVHLRAEGAFIVSSEMKDGLVRWIEIISEVGGVCRVRNPWEKEKIEIIGLRDKFKIDKDDLVFKTEPGSVYTLKPKAGLLPRTLLQFKRYKDEQNPYGVKMRQKRPQCIYTSGGVRVTSE